MPFTQTRCPKCNKVAESKRSFDIAGQTVHLLKCDHILRMHQIAKRDAENIVSLDGKRLFKFQCEGVDFISKSGGRALIADEMGLGKTVQALAWLALYLDEATPVAYFLKSSLKIQWQHEIMRWISKSEDPDDAELAQVIETSRDKFLPGIRHYIFSFDILRRFKDGKLKEMFEKRGIKTIIIDECQQIKNPESQRTKQVRDLCALPCIENIIGLSGTPIKNNASEYFSILNILHSERFPRFSTFLYNDCDSYFNGYGYKTGGLRDPEGFKRKTRDFIIRRERKEVMPDLPTVSRSYQFRELGKDVEEAYKTAFLQFRDDYFTGGASSFAENSNILAYMSRMRHLAGLSKVEPCVEHLEEFLLETDRQIVVFIHHKDVGERIHRLLSNSCALMGEKKPLMLTSDLNSEQRDSVVQAFKNQESRILIASTLASGEGLNLQFCSDCILLERQWNPANEEQAEGRFIRIGQLSDKVSATYFVAVGTIDELFAQIVEQKREICAKTLGGEAVAWDQSSLMKELAEVLARQGGKMWSL